MSKQAIGAGSAADDDTGDTLRAGGVKINANFDEIYSFIGDGTDLLAASARASLGLGSAATTASSDYATAAQGTKADTAVQPGDAISVPSVAVAASKTLALTDANTEQVVDAAGAVVLTIPTNAAVALATGSKVSALSIGAGSVTITASAGVTLNGVSAGSAALSAQYSAVVLTKIGTDAWVINGAHGAVA